MKISIVIGTYNQKEVLKKTLESLFHQTLSPERYEVLLIDSSSTDGTEQMVKELKPTSPFTYLRIENQGKTAARNLGIKRAVGEIIFLTDADMAADPKLLEEHLLAHERSPRASFEGLTINPDGQPYIKARLRPRQELAWSYFLSGNLSLRKSILLEAGLFDEQFKGYGWEDIELGYRLHLNKVPLYYLPTAINHHHHPVSSEGMLQRKFETGKSAALFYRKHPNLTIKLFLGLNPLAMGIYRLIKVFPGSLPWLGQYLREEYEYRRGLEEGLHKTPTL